ncbi:unnamed protein product [Musa acuminata subsp. burmannicoides]
MKTYAEKNSGARSIFIILALFRQRRPVKTEQRDVGGWGRGGSGWERWRGRCCCWLQQAGGKGLAPRRLSGRSDGWQSCWGCGPSRRTWWPTPSPSRSASPRPSSSRAIFGSSKSAAEWAHSSRYFHLLARGVERNGWRFVLLARFSPLPSYVINYGLAAT